MILPNFIVVGSARCGTTWLADNLRSHPQVFLPTKKELHFFDREYSKGIESYAINFSKANSAQHLAIGEATPAYMYFPEIASRIHRHLPDVRIIISLRNPVERAYSHYLYLKSNVDRKNRFIKIKTFEDVLRDTPRLVEEGKYYSNVKQYLDLFGERRVKVVIFERTMLNPLSSMRQIYNFLGIDGNFESPLSSLRINSSGFNENASGALRMLYKACYKKLGLYAVAKRLESIGVGRRLEIASETRAWLNEQYSETNRNLAKLLGLDLAEWE